MFLKKKVFKKKKCIPFMLPIYPMWPFAERLFRLFQFLPQLKPRVPASSYLKDT